MHFSNISFYMLNRMERIYGNHTPAHQSYAYIFTLLKKKMIAEKTDSQNWLWFALHCGRGWISRLNYNYMSLECCDKGWKNERQWWTRAPNTKFTLIHYFFSPFSNCDVSHRNIRFPLPAMLLFHIKKFDLFVVAVVLSSCAANFFFYPYVSCFLYCTFRDSAIFSFWHTKLMACFAFDAI